MSGLVFIISAPSGSGKSTLVNGLRSSVPGLDFSVSYTTRPPRGSELPGREYYYVGREEFERMIGRKSSSNTPMSSAITTARHAAFSTKLAPKVTICCSISTFRARRNSSRHCLTP